MHRVEIGCRVIYEPKYIALGFYSIVEQYYTQQLNHKDEGRAIAYVLHIDGTTSRSLLSYKYNEKYKVGAVAPGTI